MPTLVWAGRSGWTAMSPPTSPMQKWCCTRSTLEPPPRLRGNGVDRHVHVVGAPTGEPGRRHRSLTPVACGAAAHPHLPTPLNAGSGGASAAGVRENRGGGDLRGARCTGLGSHVFSAFRGVSNTRPEIVGALQNSHLAGVSAKRLASAKPCTGVRFPSSPPAAGWVNYLLSGSFRWTISARFGAQGPPAGSSARRGDRAVARRRARPRAVTIVGAPSLPGAATRAAGRRREGPPPSEPVRQGAPAEVPTRSIAILT